MVMLCHSFLMIYCIVCEELYSILNILLEWDFNKLSIPGRPIHAAVVRDGTKPSLPEVHVHLNILCI